MRIHAYRRKDAITVDLTPIGAATQELISFAVLQGTPHVVADVTLERHVRQLLAVPEAYREFREDAPVTPTEVDTAADAQKRADTLRRQAELDAAEKVAQDKRNFEAAERLRLSGTGTLIGSSVLPGIISLTGSKTISLGDLVASAHAASAAYTDDGMALSVEQWNELQGEEREAILSRHLEKLENKAEAEEEEAAAELRMQAKRDEDAQREADANAAAAVAAAKFVLVNGEAKIDLKTMTDTELRTFARTYEVKLPVGIKGDEIRQVIFDKLAPPAEGATDGTSTATQEQ